MHRWTKEEIDFLYKFVPGHHYREIVDEYKSIFGTEITREQIKNKLRYLPFDTGLNGRFKKGQTSPKSEDVGTERKVSGGYIEIKIAQPNKWVKKHRLIYEKHYGVELKPRDYVIFLDGNKENFEIENLEMVTLKELFFINKNFDFDNATTELRKSMIALAKANVRLMDAKRSRKG